MTEDRRSALYISAALPYFLTLLSLFFWQVNFSSFIELGRRQRQSLNTLLPFYFQNFAFIQYQDMMTHSQQDLVVLNEENTYLATKLFTSGISADSANTHSNLCASHLVNMVSSNIII